MAETPPGIADLLNLLGSANPLGPLTKNLDSMKKGVESLSAAVQSFTRTMEALEAATTRITALLDDVEAPVRSLAGQIGAMPPDSLPRAVQNLNLLSTNLSQLVAPLTGVAGLAGSFLSGLRSPAAPAAPPAATVAPASAAPTVRSRRKDATPAPKGD
ncbi:MAG: hypothetical protein F2934_08270 [Actinobacteria bacterium]|uniref:Unannotated protein n=1 Tax=freshwater metagenome TaxID=449393 RepID=A0A6J6RM21_9ZZZZ|nr:hypothetical protein [Actinomycetota bacterium]MSZ03011.1 hypothetical protein [Actinomycetota bacterium]MTB07107.1 hypothetical protein [Actinomycetota bacterium]